MSAIETHKLPSGESVYYRDSDHSYWRESDGEKGKGRLTGISTVVGPLDFRPDNLMRWAARSNGAGVAMLAAEGLSLEDADDMRAALRWLESPESIWRALEDNQATYEDLRDQAAERGTNVHKHSLHAMALGQAVPSFDEMTDEERGYSRGVMAFFHEHEPQCLESEQVIADLTLGVAGRYDLRCIPQARCDDPACPCHHLLPGGTAMLDAKTSGFLPLKAHAQVAGYAHCAEVCRIGASDAQWILQVDADGGYKLVQGAATTEDFTAALDVYRRAARIGKDARAEWKARQAVAA